MSKAKRLQEEAEEEFRQRYGVMRGLGGAQGPFGHAVTLGQVPLVLGPSSWGFPGALPPGPVARVCPPGTVLLEDGTCGSA